MWCRALKEKFELACKATQTRTEKKEQNTANTQITHTIHTILRRRVEQTAHAATIIDLQHHIHISLLLGEHVRRSQAENRHVRSKRKRIGAIRAMLVGSTVHKHDGCGAIDKDVDGSVQGPVVVGVGVGRDEEAALVIFQKNLRKNMKV